MAKKHHRFLKEDREWTTVPELEIKPVLAPGSYTVSFDTRSKKTYFNEFKINGDKLVDIPDTEYDEVKKEVDYFLTEECRNSFKDYGFLYKRNILLYGNPGTGKTCIANRISQQVIKDGGIVLFNPEPTYMMEVFEIFNEIQPDTKLMVIFEELDELLETNEEELLSILDGEIQKENIIFVATTNYIDKIHPRIRRPGRFASVIEVGYPSDSARSFYLKTKMNLSGQELSSWIEKTNGFSIDELKETVLSVKCLKHNLDAVLTRICETKNLDYGVKKSNKTFKEKFGELFEEEEDEYNGN